MESARRLSAAPILPKITEYSAELRDPSKNRGVFPRGSFLHKSATAAVLNSSRVYRGFDHPISFVFESWREREWESKISACLEKARWYLMKTGARRARPSILLCFKM